MTAARDDGRLACGAADVALRGVVAGAAGASLDDAVKDYDVALGLDPALSIVVQVRLAVICSYRQGPQAARRHAEVALREFDTGWARRPVADFDLLELRALALLISGDPGSAAAAREEARAALPLGGRFDSVRVGVYDFLTDDHVGGFGDFAAAIPRDPELS
ncbi:hypothetical protein AB0J83_30155 [Actinoplanes sp. NPDC049596]|uniref:hypothetical protein n=1 Tax=unclassified Actinoplanes TaxID=2626549 RepID=UPI0034394CCF